MFWCVYTRLLPQHVWHNWTQVTRAAYATYRWNCKLLKNDWRKWAHEMIKLFSNVAVKALESQAVYLYKCFDKASKSLRRAKEQCIGRRRNLQMFDFLMYKNSENINRNIVNSLKSFKTTAQCKWEKKKHYRRHGIGKCRRFWGMIKNLKWML